MTSSGLAGKSTLNTLLQPTLRVNGRNRAIAPPVFKNLTELTISISDKCSVRNLDMNIEFL
jgi:hypothetical protein